MTTLNELIEMGKEELKEGLPDCYDEGDFIFEIADGLVPVYTSDLLELAMENLEIATCEPEIFAFDGTRSPINGIAGNVYQFITEELYGALEDIKAEIEEESYILCEHCDEEFHKDDLFKDTAGGIDYYYCEDCKDKES